MRDEFIMSATNTIEGCPTKKHIDTICPDIMTGINIFFDLAALFIDLFGGRSDPYRRKSEIIYGETPKVLKQKALNLGVNAIVGFRVDFDEIPGKDKSIFMASVSGTACIIEVNNEESSEKETTHTPISQFDSQRKIGRRYITSQIKGAVLLTSKWVEFLLEYPQTEIIESLIKRYISVDFDYYAEEATNIKRVPSVTPPDFVTPVVYQRIEHKKIRVLIKKCCLLDGESIYGAIVRGKIHEGVKSLPATKNSCDARDLRRMKIILEYLNNLPDTGKAEVVKGGVSARDSGEKYICESGYKNPADSFFCERCGVNMRGMTEGEVKHIDPLKERYSTTEQYIQ